MFVADRRIYRSNIFESRIRK